MGMQLQRLMGIERISRLSFFLPESDRASQLLHFTTQLFRLPIGNDNAERLIENPTNRTPSTPYFILFLPVFLPVSP